VTRLRVTTNSKTCIRYGDVAHSVLTAAGPDQSPQMTLLRQFSRLWQAFGRSDDSTAMDTKSTHAPMPIRAMSSGEPLPCTVTTRVHEYFSSAQLPFSNYETTRSGGRCSIGSPTCSSSTPAYRFRTVRGTYRHVSCVLRPAACNSYGARYCFAGTKACHSDSDAWDVRSCWVGGCGSLPQTCRSSFALQLAIPTVTI
jgi:hypothetical protein